MDDVYQISDWKKISLLGSGGFGVVTLWKNVVTEDYIAVKKCKFHMPSSLSSKQKEIWQKEVQIMKLMNHPNIVGFVDIPKDLKQGLLKNNPSKLPIMSMEYCAKGNLRSLLQKTENISGLEEHDIRYILNDISSGIQYLHNLRIIHRDIKPDNIVLQHCNERKRGIVYKIIDLGYAKELTDPIVSFVGTLHYLAPEIYETTHYDKSVDYWSFGVTTFEIICGVLPFLSHLSPPDRFEDLKRKNSNDISIYLNYSGQITYTSELKEEILISGTFKYYIEEWLRHVLHIDPVSRAQNFRNGTNVLEYLQQILKKKIVKFFALHNFEFYSFEINDNTSVDVLKDWISMTTKIPRKDLLLLFRSDCLFDELLDDLGIDDYVFIINKNGLLCYPINYKFPQLIRQVMKSAFEFRSRYLRQLYGQAVYFVSVERLKSSLYRCGLQYYVNYLKEISENLRIRSVSASKRIDTLLVRIDCCCFIHQHCTCDKWLCKTSMHRQCLSLTGKLLIYLQMLLKAYIQFKAIVNKTFDKLRILITVYPKIVALVDKFNINNQYDLFMNVLSETDNGKNSRSLKKEVTTMVSQSIFFKETLLKNKTFKAFLSGLVNINKNIENYLLWIARFDKNIRGVSYVYMNNEVMYFTNFKNSNEYKTSEQSSDSFTSKQCENFDPKEIFS